MEAVAWVLGLGIAAFLLFRFPKPFLITIAILLAIGASVGVYFWGQQWQQQREQSLVEMTAAVDDRCTSDYPIFIGTTNKATRTVERVAFNIRAYRPGYSDPVYSDTYKSSDRIVEPGQGWGTCWSLSSLYGGTAQSLGLKSLRWVAELISVRFAQ